MRVKKGLSPVIATMLLIVIVIIIALIIFFWFKGLQDEAITKFDGENVKLVCERVSFEADFSGGTIYVTNTGNIPIYRMKAQVSGGGSHFTETISSNWPSSGLNQGGAFSGTILGDTDDATKIILIPVLVGETDKGEEKAYTCDERSGYEIPL